MADVLKVRSVKPHEVEVVNAASPSAGASQPSGIPPSNSVDFLSLLSAANRRRVLQGSKRVVHPAGTIAPRPSGPAMPYLIETGLARTFWGLPGACDTTLPHPPPPHPGRSHLPPSP